MAGLVWPVVSTMRGMWHKKAAVPTACVLCSGAVAECGIRDGGSAHRLIFMFGIGAECCNRDGGRTDSIQSIHVGLGARAVRLRLVVGVRVL